MEHAPAVGERVRCRHEFGVCEGVVTKIHKTPLYDDSNFDWDHDEGMPPQIGWRPESEWKVTMRPDKRPDWWAWGQNECFCPDVSTLEAL